MSPLKLANFLLTLILFGLMNGVENKSHFRIGSHVMGDQLLLKDVVEATPPITDQYPAIVFNYALTEPLTYIEIESHEDISAFVDLSFQSSLIRGFISGINGSGNTPRPAVMILIYGFNESAEIVDASKMLQRNDVQGLIQPDVYYDHINVESGEDFDNDDYDDEDYDQANQSWFVNVTHFGNLTHDLTFANNSVDDYYDDDDEEDDLENVEDENEFDWGHINKDIVMGKRQKGDKILYESYETSLKNTKEPTKHQLVFYYIDNAYITQVKIVIFDHFINTSDPDYKPPSVEYTHFTPSTMKAIVTDYNTTSLFAKIYVFGYELKEVPVDYVSFTSSLGSSIDFATDSPPILSAMQRLKMQMMSLGRSGIENEIQHIRNLSIVHKNAESNSNDVDNYIDKDDDNDDDDDDNKDTKDNNNNNIYNNNVPDSSNSIFASTQQHVVLKLSLVATFFANLLFFKR